VVGMRGVVTDASARAFAVGFYRALSVGETVADALEHGCSQVALDGARGFRGVDVVVQDGVDLSELRLVGGGRPAVYGPIKRAAPSAADLDALARLVDLDALTTSERAAIAAPARDSRGLVALLQRLAVMLGRTRARAGIGAAPAQVDEMLAMVTKR